MKNAYTALICIALAFTLSCSSGGGSTQTAGKASGERITSATDASDIPGGPDSVGGIGDYLLANKHLRAVVGQAGLDADLLPVAYGFASSGGNLDDLATAGSDNDQWNQMSQGIIGLTSILIGTEGIAYPSPAGTVFIDFSNDFTSTGILAGDVLVITSGVNAGRSYQVASVYDPDILVLFVAPGCAYDNDPGGPPTPGTGTINYLIYRKTNPLNNVIVYDNADLLGSDGSPVSSYKGTEATLRLSGEIQHRSGLLPDGTDVDPVSGHLTAGGVPIDVETDYILGGDNKYMTVETRVLNPGGTPCSISALTDIVIAGDISEPDILPWTQAAGFQAQGLDSPVYAPFVGFRGRNTPEASYAVVDLDAGAMLHASDGNLLAVNTQVSFVNSIGSGETLTWRRHVIVGQDNGVSSASDIAISLLGGIENRTDPGGITLPNGYLGEYTIKGTVKGAPGGTTVSVTQVSPALVYDPGPPYGVTNAAGFYPSTVLGIDEPLITMAEPDEATGSFSLKVPKGFAGLSGTGPSDLHVPDGFVNGTQEAVYRVLVEAPGQEPQSVLVSTSKSANNLVFDLSDGGGTLEIVVTDDTDSPMPVKVLIIGKDPDGTGPAPVTPDPMFGGSDISTAEQRASGTGNVLYLLDGTATVKLPPGAYQVIAGRGLEYSVGSFPPQGASTDFFMISAGQTVRTVTNGTPIRISRLLDSSVLPDILNGGTFESPLRRYVSADLNVKTGRSDGSSAPVRDVLISYLASGVEILVSTDNDRLTDLSGTLSELDDETTLDLAGLIRAQVGVKSTGSVTANTPGVFEFPNGIGQFSAWPLTVSTTEGRDGAPPVAYRSPGELFEKYRALGASLVQMNNPRYPIYDPPILPIGQGFLTVGKAGYPQANTGTASLSGGGYLLPLRSSYTAFVASNDGSLDDLNTVRTVGGTRYNDFDLMEIYTGSEVLYDINKLDWFALTSAGYMRTATANSRVSDFSGAFGVPRNFVFVSGDGSADLGSVSMTEFNDTLKPSLVQPDPGTTVFGVANYPAAERAGAGTGSMEVLGSSGPVVFLEVDANEGVSFEAEGYVGNIVADDLDASVDVRVTILAAPWVPVDTAYIRVNGYDAAASPLTGLGGSLTDISADLSFGNTPMPADQFSSDVSGVVRLRGIYTVSLPSVGGLDHWITAEARGNVTAGSIYDLLAPDIGTVIGFTNPVFINTNADAEYDPNSVP